MTVDGTSYEDVGVRKKGFFGSLSRSKPSLKIRFDKFIDRQTHETLTRLTLNNGRQDPTLLRTCLAYGVFARAGVPAPRCNFAHLTVNGQPLGVYAHVESLKKPFLRRHFVDPDGHLYEGTLSDFRPEYRGTIEQKNDEANPYPAPIDRLVEAAQLPDAALLPALEAALDLDRFLSFWAAEVLTAHWDGYAGNTNNFWFYDDPTSGRVVFIPWGPDATFGPPRLFFEGARAPWSVFASGILARRLYLHPEGQARYLARLDALLEEVWDAAALQAQVDAWTALITPVLSDRVGRTHAGAVTELKTYLGRHARDILAERLAGPIPWEYPLRRSLCQVPLGQVAATFETTWGTWPTDDTFATGTGTVEGTIGGEPLETLRIGGAIGPGEEGDAIIILPIVLASRALVFFYLRFDPDLATVGEIDIEGAVECSYNAFDPETRQVTGLANCPEGQLAFEAIERTPGAPVRGRFEVSLWGTAEP